MVKDLNRILLKKHQPYIKSIVSNSLQELEQNEYNSFNGSNFWGKRNEYFL